MLQFIFWIILLYMKPTYTFYFLLSWTLFKNSKNIRLWHSLCFKDFLFLLGISKKVTWLCLPDNGEATRHFFFSFFYSFFCKFSFFFLQTTHSPHHMHKTRQTYYKCKWQLLLFVCSAHNHFFSEINCNCNYHPIPNKLLFIYKYKLI